MKISCALFACCLLFCCSCRVSRQLNRTATKMVIRSEALKNAHVGISVFEPATGKYWYNYQGDHYFVPASNTKIVTCYAAMKYLGDSIVGLRYFDADSVVYIQPAADPTLLHRAYKTQLVYEYLRKSTRPVIYVMPNWQSNAYGAGWSWDDYNDDYMAERAPLPVYGNIARFQLVAEAGKLQVKNDIPFFRNVTNRLADSLDKHIRVIRHKSENLWEVFPSKDTFSPVEIPFITDKNLQLLEDTLHRSSAIRVQLPTGQAFKKLYSQPTDSVLQPMMYRSDNFFAEQCLLMVSNEQLNVMNDTAIIDTLLQTDFKDLPQKPRWVDGSGLSRYNLFTPQDFVVILNKMRSDFGMARVQRLLPTGGTGTFKNYYKKDSGYFFAKTGSMSGVNCISGFLYTRKNKLLIFSVLVNNQQTPAAAVRHTVEAFLENIRKQY